MCLLANLELRFVEGSGLEGQIHLRLEHFFEHLLDALHVFGMVFHLFYAPGVACVVAQVGERDGEGGCLQVACFEHGVVQGHREREIAGIGNAGLDRTPGGRNLVTAVNIAIVSAGDAVL